MIYVVLLVPSFIFTLCVWIPTFRKLAIPQVELVTLRRLQFSLDLPNTARERIIRPVATLRCGFSPDAEIRLPAPAGAPRATTTFELRPGGRDLVIDSPVPLLIGGVKRRRGYLRAGDNLRIGSSRLTYLGLEEKQIRRKVRRTVGELSTVLAPALLVTFLLVGLILPFSVFRHRSPRSEPGQLTVEKIRPRSRPWAVPRLRLIAPSEPLPRARVDVLFIHAHPDDEAIDFGALLAHCSRQGLRTGVILLTDGEGGIYRQGFEGPRDSLPELRIAEARRSLSLLGSAYYVRLGLPNHPYNGLAEEISTAELFERWGGRNVLEEKLADLIDAFWPRVIVSPDGASQAREHFEHVGTGILVADALRLLAKRGDPVPEGHLVSVDPRQRTVYPGSLKIPRRKVLEIQRTALRAHDSQADASIVGVEMIDEFKNEYYAVRYWSYNEPPEAFFHAE